ncbi:hypothetical protein CPB83DRAFT_890143 [Crepidotus variabilis]|uniref:Uncharacterized protein n=1 Tax=Crepidotus variabilis TaxID=179855 RepID=A0A9P6ER32_9AGAR|nr:hypothetical protein CPB83DRAFT_890143 [Crepidotus variabilis]
MAVAILREGTVKPNDPAAPPDVSTHHPRGPSLKIASTQVFTPPTQVARRDGPEAFYHSSPTSSGTHYHAKGDKEDNSTALASVPQKSATISEPTG